jgi:hypothetical protein
MADDTLQDAVTDADRTHPHPVGEPIDYFPLPETKPNLFEIGLVMGGTGATGPYSAGVLDFLIQALDEWEKICLREDKELVPVDQWTVPHHKVRIRIITGTSGGGICSLLTGRALHFAFPPAVDGSPEPILAANPYYDVWVNGIKIDKFLDCSDLVGHPLPAVASALNGQLLVKIANDGLSFPSLAQRATLSSLNLRKPERNYINNPLPVIVTHTNLTGIPYRQPFVANSVSAEYFTNHADYVRVYFGYPLPLTQDPATLIPNTPFVPAPTGNPGNGPSGLPTLQWPLLAPFALGTAAVPGALPARQIARNGVDYAYRFAWDTVKGKYSWLEPDWSAFTPAKGWPGYGFVALDGGCTDNEPVLLARQTLEGITPPVRTQHHSTAAAQPTMANAGGHVFPLKSWDKDKADRAVVLVDPLCEIPHDTPDAMSVSLVSTLPRAVDMFKQTSRFATADICDFLHPDVHNRFLVAPKRTNPRQPSQFEEGADALCGEAMGAFLGFLSPAFRHHDFMLGRYNCQAFLEGTFTLGAGNPVFMNTPSLATRVGTRPASTADYNGPVAPAHEYPVIPLCGSAAVRIPEPQWPPKGALDPQSLHKLVKVRAGKIMRSLGQVLTLNWFRKLLYGIVVWWMRRRVADKFVAVVKDTLKTKYL